MSTSSPRSPRARPRGSAWSGPLRSRLPATRLPTCLLPTCLALLTVACSIPAVGPTLEPSSAAHPAATEAAYTRPESPLAYDPTAPRHNDAEGEAEPAQGHEHHQHHPPQPAESDAPPVRGHEHHQHPQEPPAETDDSETEPKPRPAPGALR